jgi:hypothetical protein
MKLAFSGQARYTDFAEAYDLYVKRSRSESHMDETMFHRVIRMYCGLLADALFKDGQVDLPCSMGTIAAAIITRKPQYRGKKFIGFGGRDYKNGGYDGKLKTFGLVYLPRHDKNKNLRCFGFVANRKLFKRIKRAYADETCSWSPITFDTKMI